MKKTQTNRKKTQTNITPILWHELEDRTSETISGGAEGCLAWSIRFGDVTRNPPKSP
ncbi:hypothetical protein [Tychonema sp. LEGE 07203]|uniref:hypothetical protein n=1 Tax=Tychonema sp. LEGE 07203 TaxID=1828671 RepID=UPI00187E2324|nr:hypothetical protein [Tychonema sp. LEGE 07203]MBE9093922.1 hypothetical protein [Tychonema sp. LEGE 07203]